MITVRCSFCNSFTHVFFLIHVSGHSAIEEIFRVIAEQSQPTFDDNFNLISFYNWTGGDHALSPRVNNLGNGEPKAYTGMVGTHHRPSDDLSVYGELNVIWYL